MDNIDHKVNQGSHQMQPNKTKTKTKTTTTAAAAAPTPPAPAAHTLHSLDFAYKNTCRCPA